MPANKPRGRPRAALSPALPPVVRILLTAAECHSQREEVRRACRGNNPTFASLEKALAILRPKDKDGGWCWLGRELGKA